MSESVEDLTERLAMIQREREALRVEERGINESIDSLLMKQRPTFPTEHHKTGIIEAARRIKYGIQSNSHHGDPCAPEGEGDDEYFRTNRAKHSYDVTCELRSRPDYHFGRIAINHRSPFSKTRTGSKVWGFTDYEIDVLLSLIKAEGVTIVDHWHHDQGISVLVRTPETT